MYRKQNRTDKYQNISVSDWKLFVYAKQIQTHNCQKHRQPDHRTAFLLHKKSDHRNDHNITRCNETGFSDGCILDADLLEIACQAQGDTTADPAGQQCFSLCFFFLFADFFCLCLFFPLQEKNTRDQHQSSQNTSHKVEGKRSDILHPHALGNKRHAPDACRQ